MRLLLLALALIASPVGACTSDTAPPVRPQPAPAASPSATASPGPASPQDADTEAPPMARPPTGDTDRPTDGTDRPTAVDTSPRRRPLTDEERAAMTGVSWRDGCPVSLDDLRVLELPHHTPDGGVARGKLVVHHDAADALEAAFAALFEQGFVITRMRPVRHYGGDDGRSMAADNTSAFNCRPVAGGRSWSEHAYGRAVDVNPLRNPYVRGGRVDPPGGRDWLERDAARPGVLVSGSPAVEAFRAVGWSWGGHWKSLKDYQHFSRSGR